MRSSHDAIITSSTTIQKDNPSLNCRIKGLEMTSPAIIILDNYLKISMRSKVIKSAFNSNVIIFYNKFDKRKIKLLKKSGIKAYKANLNKKGNLNLEHVLKRVKELGFYRIFLESGIKLASSFIKDNLVNDLKIFMSNDKLNNNGSGSLNGYLKSFIKKNKYTVEKVNLFGDKLISYKIK